MISSIILQLLDNPLMGVEDVGGGGVLLPESMLARAEEPEALRMLDHLDLQRLLHHTYEDLSKADRSV